LFFRWLFYSGSSVTGEGSSSAGPDHKFHHEEHEDARRENTAPFAPLQVFMTFLSPGARWLRKSKHHGINRRVVFLPKLGLIVGMKKKAVVVVNPEIMSGEPCFAGTRVPVRALLDYIEGDETLEAFLEQYPTVARKQAVAFLEQASQRLLAAT
jgi:uncharacterized protein (DUF433 family)